MITHDIDEALLLADRLMMTQWTCSSDRRGNEYSIFRRNRTRVMEDPEYYNLRNQAFGLLVQPVAHEVIQCV